MNGNKNGKKVAIGVAMAAVIIGSVIAMLAPALVAKDVPSGKVGIYYLVPDDSSVPEGYCHSTNVELRVNTTGAIRGGKVTLTFDRSCVNITGITFNTAVWNDPNANKFNSLPDKTVILYGATSDQPSGDYLVGDLVLHCNSSSSCCACNVSIIETTMISNQTGNYYLPVDVSADNGTFICGETFSKELYAGWNLFSLPLTPGDNSTSRVLASVWGNVSAVYRYDAASKQFESVMDKTMDPGEGYFVYVSRDCTWKYNGTPYTSMNVGLKKGLNLVGWLNCSKSISDALSSIAPNYNYVARWNASAQEFEVYVPGAPFNDFEMMEPGTGYFISAKSDMRLTESCG